MVSLVASALANQGANVLSTQALAAGVYEVRLSSANGVVGSQKYWLSNPTSLKIERPHLRMGLFLLLSLFCDANKETIGCYLLNANYCVVTHCAGI